MTYIDFMKSSADITTKLNQYTTKHHSVTIEADKSGIKVVVWDLESGNRKPVAMSVRKCIGDCLNEIDKQIVRA